MCEHFRIRNINFFIRNMMVVCIGEREREREREREAAKIDTTWIQTYSDSYFSLFL